MKIMNRYLALLAMILLTACGGGGLSGSGAGTTQVSINLAPQLVAANDVTLPYQFARIESPRQEIMQQLLSRLISDAHAVVLSNTNTGLSYIDLHITGVGVSSASINADYNNNRFTLDADNEDAIKIEETEVSLDVPNDVALTFVVEAFNADGYQLFRGVSELGVSALAPADVSLPISLVVAIDERIEVRSSNTSCTDTDSDSFCDYYEDLFLNPLTGEPDIDDDGFPNSNDADADGDGVTDYLDGNAVTNGGYPRFVMINMAPDSVTGAASVAPSQSVDIAVSDLTIVDADENEVFTIVSVGSAESGSSSFASDMITYVAPSGGASSDNFLVTIADLNGEQVSGSIQITITADETVPVFDDLPLAAVIVEATGAATPLILAPPTATDASSAVSISSDAPAAFSLGNTTVTWTATDADGNTATATQLVSMVDNLPPAFDNLPLSVLIEEATALNTPLILAAPTATDIFAVSMSSNAPVNFPLGDTTVTWTATDANGNSATATQLVTLEDTTAPSIGSNTAITGFEATGVLTTVPLTPPAAPDLVDGAIVAVASTAGSELSSGFPLGTTTVTWTATDANNNSSTSTQDVTVVDTTDPLFTSDLPLDDIIEDAMGPETPLTLTPPTATDAFAVTVTNDAPADFPLGETTVIWTATDANGNSATETQLVTLEDNIPPMIFDFANLSIEAADTTDTTTYVDLSSVYVEDDVDVTLIEADSDAPAGWLFPLGLTTVTWTAIDASGNETTEVQEIMVGSLALCQNNIANGDYLLAADQCGAALLRINYAPTVGDIIVPNERDMANFMYAFSRVMAVSSDVDVLSGNPISNIADLLAGFGCEATVPLHEAGSDMNCVFDINGSTLGVYPSDSPTATDVQDFMSNKLKPELVGAIANLGAISTAFNMSWSSLRNPENTYTDVNLESDYGDVLFLRASMNAGMANLLMSILAHDMASVDIDDLHNNPVTTQAFLAAYPSVLTRLIPYENNIMRNYFIAAMNDSKAAAQAIQAETDDQINDLIVMDALEIDNTINNADDALACLSAVCVSSDNNTPDPLDDDKIDLTKLDSVDIRADILPAFVGDDMTGFLPGNSDLGGLLVQLEGQTPADILDRDRDNNNTADIFQDNLYEVFATNRTDIFNLTESEYIAMAADPEGNGFVSLGAAQSLDTTTTFSGAYKHYLIKVVDNGAYLTDVQAIFDSLDYSCSEPSDQCGIGILVGVIWGQYFGDNDNLALTVDSALDPAVTGSNFLWVSAGDFLLIDTYEGEDSVTDVVDSIIMTTQKPWTF